MTAARTVLVVMALAMLAGCHPADDVSIDARGIVLHQPDLPAATITLTGDFTVGAQTITVSSAQRTLLEEYSANVIAVHRDRDAMKAAGRSVARQALHMVGNKLRNAVAHSSSSAQANTRMAAAIKARGEAMNRMVVQLCREVHQVEVVQATLARQVSAFRPYANIDAAAQVHCDSWTTRSTSRGA